MIHTHTVQVYNFEGDFLDAQKMGLEEASEFFPFCPKHDVDALESGALTVEVHSAKGHAILGDKHSLTLVIKYDDEVDLDEYHEDNCWEEHEDNCWEEDEDEDEGQVIPELAEFLKRFGPANNDNNQNTKSFIPPF